jgi:hypothetical protein
MEWDKLVRGSMLDWELRIRRLRAVVKLHEAITSGDPGLTDALVSRSGKTAVFDMDGWQERPSSDGSKRPWPGETFRQRPLKIEGTGQASRLEVATRFRDRGIFRALGDRPQAAHLQMSGGELRVVPTNLLGAMWIQLAVAIAEDKRFRKCPARDCTVVWFEVSTGPLGVREDAEFCSARCRHTAYRDRKTSAKQMHRDGVSVKEIAKSLKTDVRRVRGWLGKKRR